jgi:hypothetical protein
MMEKMGNLEGNQAAGTILEGLGLFGKAVSSTVEPSSLEQRHLGLTEPRSFSTLLMLRFRGTHCSLALKA